MNIKLDQSNIESIIFKVNEDASVKLNMSEDTISLEVIDKKKIREEETKLEELQKEKEKYRRMIDAFGEVVCEKFDFEKSKQLIDKANEYVKGAYPDLKINQMVKLNKNAPINKDLIKTDETNENQIEESLDKLAKDIDIVKFKKVLNKADEYVETELKGKSLEDLYKTKTKLIDTTKLSKLVDIDKEEIDEALKD